MRNAHDYEKIVNALDARGVSLDEPVLLMPPPAFDCGLQDSPYRLASVDAIVVHPPDESVAPAKRTVLFPDAMQRVAGRWTASQWPVVVSAYKMGEPASAVPLDQVMLRQPETDFVLWIPDAAKYEIRVFNRYGLLDSRVDRDADVISVDGKTGRESFLKTTTPVFRWRQHVLPRHLIECVPRSNRGRLPLRSDTPR